MRDVLIVSIVLVAALVALRRPWVGVLLWTWLSLMNPHRYTWGFAYDAPVAMLAAVCTLVGLLLTKDRESPFKGAPTVWFVTFTLWITVSWLLGLDPKGDYPQWDKVMKINMMVFVALALIRHKAHIVALAWVSAFSIALLGAKGGLFTVLTGGSYRVWGPPASFIADNNEFALATVMAIPLVRFLQLQMNPGWRRHALTVIMLLCAAAALGSHSRGGFLAILAMSLVLWWRGKSKVVAGVVFLVAGLSMIAFMPDEWGDRMSTIQTYSEDLSALGRFSAWWVSWRVALDYPTGVGFMLARPELFELYSPYPELGTPVAHSIYFQVLGHHGFVGLFLFTMIWVSTWRLAGRLRKLADGPPQARWCADLGSMAQVSIVGYLVGGAFLSLSYFDLPYYTMALVCCADVWARSRRWETEPEVYGRWAIPGVAGPSIEAPRVR